MTLDEMKSAVRSHPDFSKVGMVLHHNGVVRATSRDGRPVIGLRVAVDHDRLAEVLQEAKARPGIVEVLIWIAEDRDLTVGDDVMLLTVAGDIRDNVVPVLSDTLNAVKATVTAKTEFFAQ